MKKDESIALTRRLLEHVNNNTSDSCESPLVEDSDTFTCATRWAAERQQFFIQTPQVIGFAGEVAQANSYLATESMGIPVLVTRDGDGKLRAFINACAHRGAKIAEGSGCAKRLICQFHGWSYALDGRLTGRPCEKAFANDTKTDASQCGLVALPISDRHGLLVIGLDASLSQHHIDNWLTPLSKAFAGFNFSHMRHIEQQQFAVAANWKLVVNLSHESYHFSTLHRDSLAPLMSHHAAVDDFDPHSRWAFPLKAITQLNDTDEQDWPSHPPGAINHTIFPGTVVITNGQDAQLIRTEPGDSPGSCKVFYLGAYSDETKLEASRQAYAMGGRIFSEEDLPIAEQCQQGMTAKNTMHISGCNEAVVQIWQRRWRENLSL